MKEKNVVVGCKTYNVSKDRNEFFFRDQNGRYKKLRDGYCYCWKV